MQPCQVLVAGGYGFFGQRLVERLSRQQGLHVLVAGRSMAKAELLVERLQPVSAAALTPVALDIHAPDFATRLGQLVAQVVVHACGPFQGQDYTVARACLQAGAHYIDLADGRDFVANIGALNEAATSANLFVASGASSVPALSGAVVDELTRTWSHVESIDIGISPGNRTDRGLATVQAILGYCGKRLPTRDASHGWWGAWRHRYPAPVGSRLLSPCDVPDLTLLPGRYPGHPAVRFGAGLELEMLHRGMNVLAGMRRIGLVSDWSRHAGLLKAMADWFKTWGSDAGAMHVQVTGRDGTGTRQSKTWHLTASAGDGPYVPTLAAAALVRKLAAGQQLHAGARPCIGLLSIDDFVREAQGLSITMEHTV